MIKPITINIKVDETHSHKDEQQKTGTKKVYICMCVLTCGSMQSNSKAGRSIYDDTGQNSSYLLWARYWGRGEGETSRGGRTLRSGYKNVSHVQVHQTVPSACEHLPVCKLHLNRKF